MRICLRIVPFLLLASATLHARTWPVSRFSATVQVSEDGSAVIIERFEFRTVPRTGPLSEPVFRQFMGYDDFPDEAFYRSIPTDVPGPDGTRQLLLVHILSVTVDDAPAAYERHNHSNRIELRIPVAPGPNRRVEIDYAIDNAIRFLADHDELYWDLANRFGTDLGQVSLQIVLPDRATGQFRAQALVMGRGPMQRLTPEVSGPSVAAETASLPPGRTLAADIILPQGIFQQPGWPQRAWWFLQASPIVLMPFVVFAFMYWLWWTKARNYLPGLSIAPRYEPPDGLSPAEAGTLVDDRVDPRDITSTLLDLAVRGYVRIEEAPSQEGFFEDHPDFIFRLLRPREEWGGLSSHERTMLLHVFYGGHWTMLSSLRLRFYSVAQLVANDIMEQLKSKGMYRRPPDSAPAFRMLGFAAIAALVVLAEVVGLVPLYRSWLLAGFAIAISALIVYLFSRHMTAKTFKGMRAYTQIRGFQEFINTVEQDRLQRLPADTFERFLPYAMALGVEHHWAHVFHGIATQAPDWYHFANGGLFDSILFGDHLSRMGTAARSTMLVRPRAAASSATPPASSSDAASTAKA